MARGMKRPLPPEDVPDGEEQVRGGRKRAWTGRASEKATVGKRNGRSRKDAVEPRERSVARMTSLSSMWEFLGAELQQA